MLKSTITLLTLVTSQTTVQHFDALQQFLRTYLLLINLRIPSPKQNKITLKYIFLHVASEMVHWAFGSTSENKLAILADKYNFFLIWSFLDASCQKYQISNRPQKFKIARFAIFLFQVVFPTHAKNSFYSLP